MSTRLQGEVDRGIINRNEARISKGLETVESEMMDAYTIAGSVMPLSEISIEDGTEDLSLQEEPKDKNKFPLQENDDKKEIKEDAKE